MWTRCLTRPARITFGNRQATAFVPVNGVTEQELADAAQLASLADETPEGRSIVVLAKENTVYVGVTCKVFTRQPIHRAKPHERRRY